MSKTKFGYLINYGIAPYLGNLLKDIKDSRYFSANFDETLNPVMDVQISQVNLIVIRV